MAFATKELAESMLEYRIATKLDHRSDHLPILLQFKVEPLSIESSPKRNWKNLNLDKAKANIASLNTDRLVNSKVKIEQYARYLSERLYLALDQSVL